MKIGGGLSFTDTQPFQPTDAPTTQTLPSYTLFNLLAAYKFDAFGDKWTAQINANNIFDKVYFS
ncbi:TonB-dependent receptor domain-containing protein, partial [Staphylococcus aureus]